MASRLLTGWYRGTSLIINSPPPLGTPYGPRHESTAGSSGGVVSYERGTPVSHRNQSLAGRLCTTWPSDPGWHHTGISLWQSISVCVMVLRPYPEHSRAKSYPWSPPPPEAGPSRTRSSQCGAQRWDLDRRLVYQTALTLGVPMMYSKRHLPDIEQSSCSNVIPRRARPGLAGLRPHTDAWRRAGSWTCASSSLLSSLELSDTQSLWALNTSPPRNRSTFLRNSCC